MFDSVHVVVIQSDMWISSCRLVVDTWWFEAFISYKAMQNNKYCRLYTTCIYIFIYCILQWKIWLSRNLPGMCLWFLYRQSAMSDPLRFIASANWFVTKEITRVMEYPHDNQTTKPIALESEFKTRRIVWNYLTDYV